MESCKSVVVIGSQKKILHPSLEHVQKPSFLLQFLNVGCKRFMRWSPYSLIRLPSTSSLSLDIKKFRDEKGFPDML
ncbi:MAG: hypothetical protein AAB972_01410 [Patescibacteria group bacterium]